MCYRDKWIGMLKTILTCLGNTQASVFTWTIICNEGLKFKNLRFSYFKKFEKVSIRSAYNMLHITTIEVLIYMIISYDKLMIKSYNYIITNYTYII